MITESQSKAIAWAQIIVFGVLALPSLIVIRRHGKHGLLGWLPLNSFCVIRIVGGALTLSDYHKQGHPSIATSIIAGLGISPLLLAAEGVLHEARNGRGVALKKVVEWFCVLQYHTVAIVGMILVASRGSDLANPHRSNTSQALLDVGVLLFLVCWAFMGLWTLLSYLRTPDPVAAGNTHKFRGANILLHAVALSIPFSGLRVLYALIYYIGGSTNFQSSLPARAILDIATEMIYTVVLVGAGLLTRNMYAFKHFDRAMSMEPYNQRSAEA